MRHRVAYLEIYLLAALVGGFLVWGGNMVANPTLSAALVYASYGVWAVVGLMVLINIIRPRRVDRPTRQRPRPAFLFRSAPTALAMR